MLLLIKAIQRQDSSRKSLQKNRNSMPRGLRLDKSRKRAKMPPEATVQEFAKDFDFKIITDHVDCSETNTKIAPQSQTSALPEVSRSTVCFCSVTHAKPPMAAAVEEPVHFEFSKFLGYVQKSEIWVQKKQLGDGAFN